MKVLVVLGHRLSDTGEADNILLERIDMAVEYVAANNIDRIILSGGAANPKAALAEADVMKELMLNKGIERSLLILERQSKTTRQNARFCKPIIMALNADTVVVCTSKEHQKRRYLNPIRLFKRRLNSKNIRVETV